MEMQSIKERMTMPSPEKFRETLTEFAVRQSVIDEIYLGYDGLDCTPGFRIYVSREYSVVQMASYEMSVTHVL